MVNCSDVVLKVGGSIEVVHIQCVNDDDSIRFSWWIPGEGEGGCRGSGC